MTDGRGSVLILDPIPVPCYVILLLVRLDQLLHTVCGSPLWVGAKSCLWVTGIAGLAAILVDDGSNVVLIGSEHGGSGGGRWVERDPNRLALVF